MALVQVDGDIDAALDALGTSMREAYPPLMLTMRSVRTALDRFERGGLSASTLERWAEAIHTAEDVEFDPSCRDDLSQAIFELSTPELFGTMDEIVERLRARLQRADSE